MFRRSVILATVAVLAIEASAQAGPITFSPTGDGNNLIPNFVGLDPQPGNILNVKAQTAVANFVTNPGPGPNTIFTSFGQANAIVALTSGGSQGIVGGANISTVFGTTEQVVGVGGIPGTAGNQSTFVLVPGGPVNYYEVYAGGAAGNDLAGTGFNDGTLILRATIDSFVNPLVVSVTANSAGDLDQFAGNSYAVNQDTVGLSGNVQALATVTFFDPNYFILSPGDTLIGSQLLFSTQLNDPFNAADPSAAFLTNSLLTAQGVGTTTAGAGLGTATGGLLNIGPLNGGPPDANGQSNQVQSDSNFTISPLQVEIPEPTSVVVFGVLAGLSGLVYRKRRNSQKHARTVC